MESRKLVIAAATLGLALAVTGCGRDESNDDMDTTTQDATGAGTDTTGTTGTTDPTTGTTGTTDPATGTTTPGTMSDGTMGTPPAGTTDPATGTTVAPTPDSGGSTTGGSDQTVPPAETMPPEPDQDTTPGTTEPETGANPGE